MEWCRFSLKTWFKKYTKETNTNFRENFETGSQAKLGPDSPILHIIYSAANLSHKKVF